MVVVEEVTKLSERRTQTSSEAFPDDALTSIRAAVEAVPASVFDDSTKYTEVGGFDAAIADGLSQYEYEGDAGGGYNPNCKLWSHQGFNYSVDLYDADAGIEVSYISTVSSNLNKHRTDAAFASLPPYGRHTPAGRGRRRSQFRFPRLDERRKRHVHGDCRRTWGEPRPRHACNE